MDAPPLQIVIGGASGLVGRHLVGHLKAGGHRVVRLERGPAHSGSRDISWSPERGELASAALEGVDAVVLLSGESIAGGRWSADRKQAILESRVATTGLVAKTLAASKHPPPVLLVASAVGFYGNRGVETVDEGSSGGGGFLADVCRAWEAAADPARGAGIRVAHLRLGMVLSGAGGALGQMLPFFRLGLGGRMGSGEQYMSWIELDDLLAVILHVIRTEELAGPVNAVSPNPVTNSEFTRTLGRVLRRPTPFPVPKFALRLAFGQMGQELLLEGARVLPTQLKASGFRFAHPDLESALRHALE